MVSTAWSSPIRSTASATRSGSEWSTSSGRRVSTRQKPHARVQRSPSTMNVAVPSAQHSLRFGQPASSQTVTRSSSRTARLSASTSGPWWTFGRSQSGLRVEICSPPTTPTWASRSLRCCDASRTTAPGPAPREKADRSSGRCRQATSCRSTVPPPHASAARAATASTASRDRDVDALRPQATSPALSAMPQGTMWPNIDEVGRDVEGEAVHRATPAEAHADGGDLAGVLALGVDPHAGVARGGGRQPGRPRSASASMSTCSTELHVGDRVGHAAGTGRPACRGSVRIG